MAKQMKEEALPEGCEWVTIRVPIYTGEVARDHPLYFNKLDVRMLTPQHRVGWNRVYEAIRRMRIKDPAREERAPVMSTRSDAARWLFGLIESAWHQNGVNK